MPAAAKQIDWRKEIKNAETNSSYLATGWGDKKFYLETPEFSDRKLNITMRAIIGFNTSAMHTTVL